MSIITTHDKARSVWHEIAAFVWKWLRAVLFWLLAWWVVPLGLVLIILWMAYSAWVIRHDPERYDR